MLPTIPSTVCNVRNNSGSALLGATSTWCVSIVGRFSTSTADKEFLEWREDQPLLSQGLGVREAMTVYVQQLNLASSERYEREMMMKVRKAWLLANSKGAEETPEQSKE